MQSSNKHIEFKDSPIHGSGGFAIKDLSRGTRVIEYVGERIDKKESLRRLQLDNRFIFDVTEEFDIDGSVPWNPARLLNHSCEPNCDAEKDGERIWIVANRKIRAGEEITFNYNYDLDDYKEHPCRCGVPACVGFILAEEFHPMIAVRAGA